MKKVRIVSLVPSLSELVWDLGLGDKLVGCTNFCIAPRELQKKAKIVGGTKDPDLALITDLNPSHILVNEEENRLEDALKLKELAKVVETFPRSAEDVPQMIQQISIEFGVAEKGQLLADKIKAAISELKKMSAGKEKIKFAYFIWNRPWMLASSDTYISRMLALAGFENIADGSERYPQVKLEDLEKKNPNILFFSSEPWPFRKRDGMQLRDEWPSHPPIHLIDGKLMSWYGSTTLEALTQLKSYLRDQENHLINPMELR
ncbi:MAG: ABC transporter substrate-binding protein [Oligoflexales bacterium]|nr:ABC transporter substrate-binding protein [Oligoflexales bacterium]